MRQNTDVSRVRSIRRKLAETQEEIIRMTSYPRAKGAIVEERDVESVRGEGVGELSKMARAVREAVYEDAKSFRFALRRANEKGCSLIRGVASEKVLQDG